MPQVIAYIVGAIVTALSYVGVSAAVAYAVAVVVVNLAVSAIISAVFAPKHESVGDRQARHLRAQLGERPRVAILGRAATAGTLLNIWNDGADNRFETAVFALADHEIDAIEGVIINDKEYVLTTQGSQSHSDFHDVRSRLSIQWALGAPNQTTVSHITSEGVAAGQWTSQEAADGFKGFAYAVARYEISEKVWKAGRPTFVWIVRGGKLYDPRKDSGVQGGSGAHRWGDSSTYEWTENARVCHYNYIRGIYSYPISATVGQLMVGPGRAQEEAPAADAIADANLCDEPIPLAAGGTEPRYRVSAVIEANEKWIDVEENLAAAMGGQLVERAGTIAVDVGVWKPLGPEIVDDDFIAGSEMQYQDFKSREDLVNTVHARFIDPKQLWRQASILPRVRQEDIDADGEVRDTTLDLVFVTSQTQAQRCAEIARRRARLQRSAVFTVGPRYMLMEAGDWIRWRSQRRFAGEARTFELQGVANTEDMHVRLILSEIDGSVFDWNTAVDELDYEAAEYVQPTLPANPRQFGNLNVNGGVSGTFSGPPLTAVSPTSITITSRTWTGAGGETDTVPGGSVGSLNNTTKYWVAYDRFNDSFVASSSFTTATGWFADATGQFLVLGNATTQDGGGGGGGVGGGGGGGGGGELP